MISSKADFIFQRSKKRRLVNSMHAAAAALVHLALIRAGQGPRPQTTGSWASLPKIWTSESQLIGIKELMILAVLSTLEKLPEGADLQKEISALNAYADQSLKRILDGADSPSRVLQLTSKSLAQKYRKLFEDVPAKVATAMQNPGESVPLSPVSEVAVKARMDALDITFGRLLMAVA